jgi:hypothetical protein
MQKQGEHLQSSTMCSMSFRKDEVSIRATVERKVESKDGSLKAGNLKPGSSVSTDQYVSKLPG